MDKTILITGASRGIGLLTAKTLAKKGFKVIASIRDIEEKNKTSAEELLQWAQKQKLNLHVIQMDVAKEDDVNQVLNQITQQHKIDVVINNAGVMPIGITEGFSLKQMRSHFDINFFGAVCVTRAVLPQMRKNRNGLIINISSAAGRLAIPYFGLYCAGKWALEAYSESIHYELEPYGIESILIEPSGHGTNLVNTTPMPADLRCIKEYGTIARGADNLLNMFKDMFAQAENITDAQNVANEIVKLIEIKKPRPIRTQVGADMGVATINEQTAPVQSALINQLKPIYQGI